MGCRKAQEAFPDGTHTIPLDASYRRCFTLANAVVNENCAVLASSCINSHPQTRGATRFSKTIRLASFSKSAERCAVQQKPRLGICPLKTKTCIMLPLGTRMP